MYTIVTNDSDFIRTNFFLFYYFHLFTFQTHLPVVLLLSFDSGNLLIYLLICDDLDEDLLNCLPASACLLAPSELKAVLVAEAKDLSLESSSCSGMASESLLELRSEDHKLVTLALESIDLCPTISYLLDDVEKEEMLVTDGLDSLPTSIELSLEKAEYLLLLSLEILVKELISFKNSRSGEEAAESSSSSSSVRLVSISGDGVGAAGSGKRQGGASGLGEEGTGLAM